VVGGRDAVELEGEGGRGQEGALLASVAQALNLLDGLFDALAEGGAAEPAGKIRAGDDESLADREASDRMHDLDGLAAFATEELSGGGAGEEGKRSQFGPGEVAKPIVNAQEPGGLMGHGRNLLFAILAHSCAEWEYF
jgi:hypothetical protein